MNCDTARERLDALADGEMDFLSAWPVRRHLAHCAACAADFAAIRRLTGRVRAWDAAPAPAGLQVRLASALSATAPAPSAFRRRSVPGRRQFAASAAAALLGLGLVLGLHGHASALQEMEQAVSRAHSVHMTVWYGSGPDGNGPIQKAEELWYQDGCWRKTAAPNAGGDRIIRQEARGLEYYHYEPSKGEVAQYPESATQQSAFTLQALAGDYFPLGSAQRTQVIGAEVVNGQRLEEVLVSLADNSERMLFWVDPATGLPDRAEKQDYDSAQRQWVLQGRFQMDFNQAVPSSVFDPQSLKP